MRTITKILAVLIVTVGFMNGFTDAPNSLANCIMTRALPTAGAVTLGAVMNFVGALFAMRLGGPVSSVMTDLAGTNLAPTKVIYVMLCCSLLCVIMLAAGAWYFGIPTSESHALMAAASGASLAATGNISQSGWLAVAAGLTVSVFFGFFNGFIASKCCALIFGRMQANIANRFFKYSQIVFCALCSYMHGVQDGVKLAGMLMIGLPYIKYPTATVGIAMSAGILFGAGRIMKNVGSGFARLKPYQGASADFSSFLTLGAATALGLPVSTSHIKTAALCGVAAQKNIRRVHWKTAASMLVAWVVTFPFCFVCSYFMTAVIIAY